MSKIYQPPFTITPAINKSIQDSDSSVFIKFMLEMILDAIISSAPQVKSLLAVITKEMSSEELQDELGLYDRKSFRENYLSPAMNAGLIEMTIPDKPTSRLQKYRITQLGRRYREVRTW